MGNIQLYSYSILRFDSLFRIVRLAEWPICVLWKTTKIHKLWRSQSDEGLWAYWKVDARLPLTTRLEVWVAIVRAQQSTKPRDPTKSFYSHIFISSSFFRKHSITCLLENVKFSRITRHWALHSSITIMLGLLKMKQTTRLWPDQPAVACLLSFSRPANTTAYLTVLNALHCGAHTLSWNIIKTNNNKKIHEKSSERAHNNTQHTIHIPYVVCECSVFLFTIFIYLPCSLFVYSQWMVRVGIWWHAEHWLNSHACVAHILWPSIRSVGRNNEYFVLFTFFRLLNRKTIEEMNIEMF